MTDEQTHSICVGLDGGGTSTRLLAVDSDQHRWTDRDGASNPRIVGTERSSKVIADLIQRARREFPDAMNVRVCAGVAGAGNVSMQRVLADSVRLELEESSGVSIQFTDDATIAYEAAFAGDPGVLFMAGTGSMVLVRAVDGTYVRSGGWGNVLGDEGSGYSIGRAGLRAVAASIDADNPTALTARAEVELGIVTRDALIEKVYGSDYSLASFARAVLEEAGRGDSEALKLVDREIRQLVNRLYALIELYGFDVTATFTSGIKVTGGLSKSRPYMLNLSNVIQERFPAWKIARSGHEPVEGALWMATQMSN